MIVFSKINHLLFTVFLFSIIFSPYLFVEVNDICLNFIFNSLIYLKKLLEAAMNFKLDCSKCLFIIVKKFY